MTTKWDYAQTHEDPGLNLLKWWGDNGWELVGISPEGGHTFKRPKGEETQIAPKNPPEPEVSVTLTYSDMVFLKNKWIRWVYPKVESTELPQFDRISYVLSKEITKARLSRTK